MTAHRESTVWAWLRMIVLFAAVGLAIGYLSGCDEEDEPYIEPDALGPLCGPACPDYDGGVDGGEDAQ